jgi:hypothetical protein
MLTIRDPAKQCRAMRICGRSTYVAIAFIVGFPVTCYFLGVPSRLTALIMIGVGLLYFLSVSGLVLAVRRGINLDNNEQETKPE